VKKFIVLVVLAFVVFLVVYRERLYVRNPFGVVMRDGSKMDSAVYINFLNDVLVEDASPRRRYLVQRWNERPGALEWLVCARPLVCMTDGDRAKTIPLGGAAWQPRVAMTNAEILFADVTGGHVVITLR